MDELTIIIPTYNRLKELRITLENIIPQLNSEEVVVLDNNSQYDIYEEINDLVLESRGKVSIIRNRTNIGLSGNFMKAFELCESKYLWILSDDDIPLSNAIEKIRSYFSKDSFACVKYSSSLYLETEIIELKTMNEFLNYYSIDSQDKFSNLVFVSNVVFNMECIKPYLHYGYQYSNTFAPHLSIIFHSFFLNTSNKILISNEELVKQVPPNQNNRWTLFKVYLGFKSFEYIDVNFSKTQNEKFVNILQSCRGYYRSVFVELAKLGREKGDYTYSKKVYKYLFFDFNFNMIDRSLMLILYWAINKPYVLSNARKFNKRFDEFCYKIDPKKSDKRL